MRAYVPETSSSPPLNEVAQRAANRRDFVARCARLLGDDHRGMDPVMLQLAARAREDRATVAAAVSSEPAVMALGDQYAQLRCPDERRREGATYTPRPLVTDILERDISLDGISRIVDLGAGTGRFLLEAATHAPSAQLWAVEPDPVARMILWIRASELGLRDRLVVSPGSFHELRLPSIKGRTAFVGNPPYVRHHHIDPKIKAWARTAWEGLGLRADLRAGLHVHALAAIATQATQGDRGALLLPVEWMRVNYGRLARALCVGTLGLRGLTVYEPRNSLFKDAFVSSVVTGFTVGSRAPWVYVRAVDPGGARVATRRLLRESLSGADGWMEVMQTAGSPPAGDTAHGGGSSEVEGGVSLGDLFRVHRGQVTGANHAWVVPTPHPLVPARFQPPCVTRARDLMSCGGVLREERGLRRVIALPVDLDEIPQEARPDVERFLDLLRSQGVPDGYVARHRSAWWAVRLREPAPILMTYMARRPPIFVQNFAQARHINIAHGLYPRKPRSDEELAGYTSWLNENVSKGSGRTYAGGLTKFEPGEVMRLTVPRPSAVLAWARAQKDA